MPVWTVRCVYGEGALAKRAAALAAHEAYLVAHSSRIFFAGPTFAADGATRTGLWLMIDMAGRAEAEAFMAEEGFTRAGMFGAIEIKRFAAVGRGVRRQVEIAPDPTRRMFVCEFNGEPVAEKHRLAIAEDAVVGGWTISDDGKRRLGALVVLELAARARAEAAVAAEPLVRAGIFRNVRIDSWRFGKSVV